MNNAEAAALASQLYEEQRKSQKKKSSSDSLSREGSDEEEEFSDQENPEHVQEKRSEHSAKGIGHRTTLRRRSVGEGDPPEEVAPPPARTRDQSGWKEEEDAEVVLNYISTVMLLTIY